MKTIQKSIALGITVFSAAISFGQLGLGVSSTTQAAVNTSSATRAVSQSTQAASSATRATVQMAGTKTVDITKSTAASVQAGTRQLANSTNAGLAAGIGIQSNSNNNLQTGIVTVQAANATEVAANANVQVNGAAVIEGAGSTSNAAIGTAKEVKATLVSEVKSDLQSVKQSAGEIKSQAAVKAEVNSQTQVKAGRQ
jgi:hypothetical protein